MFKQIRCLLVVSSFLIIQGAVASAPVESEVTIDSPPEVIAEDFVNVAISPRAWKFRVWEWLGTDDIEINSIIDSDLEKSIDSEEKRTQIKEVLKLFSEYETSKRGDTLVKWAKPIVLVVNKKSQVYEHIVEVVSEIRKAIEIDITILDRKTGTYLRLIHDDEDFGTIKMTSFGSNKSDDFPINYHNQPPFFTDNFKGLNLSSIFFKNYLPNDVLQDLQEFPELTWDLTIGLTQEFRYSGKFDKSYHANGEIGDGYNYGISGVKCDIYSGHELNIQKALATECLLRALGLPRVSKNVQSNLGLRLGNLEKINWVTHPTAYDLLLLKILYDNRIQYGMTKGEAKPIVIKILKGEMK